MRYNLLLHEEGQSTGYGYSDDPQYIGRVWYITESELKERALKWTVRFKKKFIVTRL